MGPTWSIFRGPKKDLYPWTPSSFGRQSGLLSRQCVTGQVNLKSWKISVVIVGSLRIILELGSNPRFEVETDRV